MSFEAGCITSFKKKSGKGDSQGLFGVKISAKLGATIYLMHWFLEAGIWGRDNSTRASSQTLFMGRNQ